MNIDKTKISIRQANQMGWPMGAEQYRRQERFECISFHIEILTFFVSLSFENKSNSQGLNISEFWFTYSRTRWRLQTQNNYQVIKLESIGHREGGRKTSEHSKALEKQIQCTEISISCPWYLRRQRRRKYLIFSPKKRQTRRNTILFNQCTKMLQ